MTIDATVAGASSDSYLAVADADAWAAADVGLFAKAWRAIAGDAGGTTLKEQLLKRATDDIESRYLPLTSPWLRYSASQALVFPRSIDVTGTPSVAVLPYNVRRACYEQAIYLCSAADAIDEAALRRARGTYSWSDQDGGATAFLDDSIGLFAPRAEHFLSQLGAASSGAGSIVSVPLRTAYVAEIV